MNLRPDLVRHQYITERKFCFPLVSLQSAANSAAMCALLSSGSLSPRAKILMERRLCPQAVCLKKCHQLAKPSRPMFTEHLKSSRHGAGVLSDGDREGRQTQVLPSKFHHQAWRWRQVCTRPWCSSRVDPSMNYIRLQEVGFNSCLCKRNAKREVPGTIGGQRGWIPCSRGIRKALWRWHQSLAWEGGLRQAR